MDKIKNELKVISPFLEKKLEQVDNDGFVVPDDYFEQLQTQLLQQAALTPIESVPESKPLKWLPQFTFRMPQVSVWALGALLIAAAVLLIWQNNNSKEQWASIEELEQSLSQEEIEAYVTDNIEEFGDVLEEFDAASYFSTTSNALIEEIIEELDMEELEAIL